MSQAESPQLPLRLWPEPWASHAAMRIAALRGELDRVTAGRKMSEQENAAANTVAAMLDQAEQATHPNRRRGSFRGPVDRWRGTSVERTQYFLHAAQIAMVDLMSQEELAANIPAATARLDTCLAPTDIRRTAIEKVLRRERLSLAEKRAALKSALKIGYDASDQLHQRIRGFRNILITVGATILVFMSAMVVVVAVSPDSVPLCFEPTVTAGQAGQAAGTPPSTRTVCPSGEEAVGGPIRPPSPEDIAIVAGLGLVGGALAAALAIRNLRGTSLPYDVPLALAFLKVPMGALTAVVGILLLGGGFVPGLSELDSQRQILAYALLLGFAQQVGTQLIDKQAQSLLDSVPSKDPQANQPTRVTPGFDSARPEAASNPAAPIPAENQHRPTGVPGGTLPQSAITT